MFVECLPGVNVIAVSSIKQTIPSATGPWTICAMPCPTYLDRSVPRPGFQEYFTGNDWVEYLESRFFPLLSHLMSIRGNILIILGPAVLDSNLCSTPRHTRAALWWVPISEHQSRTLNSLFVSHALEYWRFVLSMMELLLSGGLTLLTVYAGLALQSCTNAVTCEILHSEFRVRHSAVCYPCTVFVLPSRWRRLLNFGSLPLCCAMSAAWSKSRYRCVLITHTS